MHNKNNNKGKTKTNSFQLECISVLQVYFYYGPIHQIYLWEKLKIKPFKDGVHNLCPLSLSPYCRFL